MAYGCVQIRYGCEARQTGLQEKGYIILVHAGTGRAPDVLPFFELTKTVKVPSSIIPVKQYSASNSGTPSGSGLACARFPCVVCTSANDTATDKIDYSNAMAMFKDGGNSSFPFDASYQEDFVRHQAEQTGLETTDGVEFEVIPRLPFHSIYTYPTIGLSVFKCLDPSAFPATFSEPTFPRAPSPTSRMITLELAFRAGAGWPGSSVSILYSNFTLAHPLVHGDTVQ